MSSSLAMDLHDDDDVMTVVVIDLLVCVAVLCGCVRYCGITLCDDSGGN